MYVKAPAGRLGIDTMRPRSTEILMSKSVAITVIVVAFAFGIVAGRLSFDAAYWWGGNAEQSVPTAGRYQ